MTEKPSADNTTDAIGDDSVTEGTAMRARPWWYWVKRIGYRLFRLSGELTAIVLGLAIFWFCALNVLLTRQSVDISGFKPNAQMWFSEVFNGSDAQIGDMQLTWLPASNNIIFDATDVVITDKDGNQIETISHLQTEIPLRAAAKGSLIPERLIIDGGSVTWMRTNNGNIIAGLGTPDTVGRLGPVWRGNRASGKTTRPDVSGIKMVTVTNATAYVVDDTDGLELTFQDTDLDFTSTPEAITVDMTSDLRKGAVSIPLKLKMDATPNMKSYAIDVTAEGLNPSVILPKRGRYAGLKTLNSSMDVKAFVKVDENKGLETADIDLTAGKGRVKLGETLAEFDKGRFKATLTTDSQIMVIEDVALESSKLNFTGSGTLSELGALTDGNINSSPLFDLKLVDINLDQTPQFSAPFILESLETSGRLDADSRRLELDNLTANFGAYGFSMLGTLQQTPDGKWDNITLKGHSFGTLDPKDILAIWPVNFARGATKWLDRSILRASIKNVKLEANLPRAVLNGESLPANENINLTFDVTDGDLRYISTMTPYTNASGRGIVSGNNATFEAIGGRIGDVKITSSFVDISNMLSKGGDIKIKTIGGGLSSDLIALIDERPFEYAKKYGVNPKDFGGSGQIELNVMRPLLVGFDRSRIKYDVIGKFENVSAPFAVGPNKLKNGFVTIAADSNGMTVKGPVNIGPWQADLNWQETFDFGATPTRYIVEGQMDRDTLDSLGIGFREYFDGEIGVKIDALGTGLDLKSAKVTADLTNASLNIRNYWSKEVGVKGTFTGELQRQLSGSILFENMDIKAPGLDVGGRIELAQNFRLLDLNLKRANIEGFIDAAVQAKPDERNEKLSVFVTGRYLDVSPFMTSAIRNQQGGNSLGVPVLLTAGLDKLVLNEAYVLKNANILLSHNGDGVTSGRIGGVTPEGELKVNVTTDEVKGVREFELDIPDASEAIFAFLKLDNISGGRMQINAQLPEAGTYGSLNGIAEIEDFKLIDAPILAQLLSVGSLTGLLDTLSGEGLNFDDFTVPFSLSGQSLKIRNARISGPALGMTGNGELSFASRELDFDGVLVPTYIANSLLGDIPLIGDIFVGKKGEGIFALNYTVKGSFSKTQVAVNPLSALTPGFLRGIFRTKRDKLPDSVIAEIESVKPDVKDKN